MFGLTREQFIEKVNRFKRVEKIEIPKTDHMDGFLQGSELKPISDKVLQQYYGLINPGIHLPAIVGKFNNMEVLKDPLDGMEYDPRIMKDDIIRYCELNRPKPIFAYKDPELNVVHGFVSPEHVPIYDRDVFDISEAFTQDIPHTTRYAHDGTRMVLDYEFPEIGIDLPDNNRMNFCLIVKNSPFGMGALRVDAGAFEQRCGNGSILWVKDMKFSWMAIHRWRSASYMLGQLAEGLNKVFAMAGKGVALLQEANEIVEPIIKENEDIVRVLRSDKFNLLKREAESVYRRIITTRQYRRLNGFDLGRAICEEARDTSDLDRRIELEVLGGRTMTVQVKH
jgi:hypothetical protein